MNKSNNIDKIIRYLREQSIVAAQVSVTNSFLDPCSELAGSGAIAGYPFARVNEGFVELEKTLAESMSLASMQAVLQLNVHSHDKVLDVCSAPGMKGLYLKYLVPDAEYYCNDVSADRLSRLKRLFTKHGQAIANMTHYDGRFIDRAYPAESFVKIIIDAPCSGEGVALGGDEAIAATWSPAKVKRLQQLQIAIVKSAWKLLKPGGRLVYATCTLNKNENERVIKKALGINLTVSELATVTKNSQILINGESLRILPSTDSIGFFIAVIEKPLENKES